MKSAHRRKTSQPPKQKAKEQLARLTEQTHLVARRTGEMELVIYNLSRENDILKDTVQLLHEKVDAIVALQNEGLPLSEDNINEMMVANKADFLKSKIDELLESKTIVPTDEIGEDSLVVSRELNKEGKVENPRLQFLISRLAQDLKDRFLGKKAGALVKGEDEKLDVEIMEIYNVVLEQQPEQEEQQQEEQQQEELSNSEES